VTEYITHARSPVEHSLRRVRNSFRDLENQRTSVQNQLIDLQLETSSTDDAEMHSFCEQYEHPVSKQLLCLLCVCVHVQKVLEDQ